MTKLHRAHRATRLNLRIVPTPVEEDIETSPEIEPPDTLIDPANDPIDPNFQSELDYDGYKDIEDYDNQVLSSNPEKETHPNKQLRVHDRKGDELSTEENLLNPQEDQRADQEDNQD